VLSDTDIIPSYSAGTTFGCKYFKAYKSYALFSRYCMPQLAWINTAASTLSQTASSLGSIFGVLDTVQNYIED